MFKFLFDALNNLFIVAAEQIVQPMPPAVNQKPKPKIRRLIDVELARRDWSQGRLAQEIGRARNTVNRAINHKENRETLQLILKTLGLR